MTSELLVGQRRPGLRCKYHCSSAGAAACCAATAMSRALKELFGQFGWIQRSLFFVYVGLEHQADQLYISPIRATQVKGSIRPNHLEMRSF